MLWAPLKAVKLPATRFADAAPLLITSTASEEDARKRLPLQAQGEDIILRFRPNVHVDVEDEQEPYDEDHWSMLAIRSSQDPAQEVNRRFDISIQLGRSQPVILRPPLAPGFSSTTGAS